MQFHGENLKEKIENLILEKEILQMKIEQNKKLETAFFSPEAFCFYACVIGLMCAFFQSINLF
jgi:hypothetical protein